MSLKRVVLPAPLRPTTASVSPGVIVNDRSLSAWLSEPGYAKLTFSNVISPRSGCGTAAGAFLTAMTGCLFINSVRLLR